MKTKKYPYPLLLYFAVLNAAVPFSFPYFFHNVFGKQAIIICCIVNFFFALLLFNNAYKLLTRKLMHNTATFSSLFAFSLSIQMPAFIINLIILHMFIMQQEPILIYLPFDILLMFPYVSLPYFISIPLVLFTVALPCRNYILRYLH